MLPQAPAPISLEKFAYDTIKKAILDFRFKPGDSLVEADLSKQLNISKTPVRDALTRLEREGLVSKVAYTGTYVSEITPESVLEIFEIRAVLEGLAARQATPNFNRADLKHADELLKQQAALLASGDLSGAADANRRFHALIVQRSNNQHLRSMLANLDDHIQRIRVLSKTQRGAQSTSVQEHQQVLDAICAGDAAAAETAMKEHLRSVLTELENVDIQALIKVVTQNAANDSTRGFSE